MTDTAEVRRLADGVISMIREDQGSGQIPADVLSLDELDNYVDIDDYYRRIDIPADGHGAAELRSAVEKEIARRLAAAQGGPWHVIWRPPGGAAQEVGRTVGYATQADAQPVGREHVHAHGGGFHLRRG